MAPRGATLVAATIGALFAGVVFVNPTLFLFDDAYFYFQIASHVARGEGTTFHGLGWTNGYHPLWLAVCVPILAAAQRTGLDAMRGVIAFQAILALVGALLAVRLSRRVALPHPTLAWAVLAVYFLAGGLWGSEGFLNGVLQLAALDRLIAAHERREAASGWLAAGAVIGLAVLARLDLVFLAAACCGSALVQPRVPGRERLRDALLLVGSTGAVVAPYLLSNLVATGHLVPVSGWVKSTFPVPEPAGVAAKLGRVGRIAALAAVAASVIARAWTSGPLARLLLVLAGGTAGHVVYVALFTAPRWSTDFDYYYVSGALTLAFCVSCAYARLTAWLPSFGPRGHARIAAALALLLVASALVRTLGLAFRWGPGGPALAPEPIAVRMGRWLGASLPRGSVVLTGDAPGRLAWFSGLPVVALDGLTSDFAFRDELRRPDLRAWMRRRGITHVVAPLVDYHPPWLDATRRGGRITLTVRGPKADEPAGVLTLDTGRALATSGDLWDDVAPDERVGVWAWPPQGAPPLTSDRPAPILQPTS